MAPAVAGGVVAYEDIFEVIDRDPDGKKFDKVSRFRCRSQFEAELQIDINVDIYNLEVCFVSSQRDRTLSDPHFPPRPQPPPSMGRTLELKSLAPHPLSRQVGTRFTMVLAPTLSLDGTPEDMSYDQSGKESLADAYEYVMYGKVFKKEDTDEGGLAKSSVNISFGGLLVHLKADPKNLREVDIDNRVYVLIRKIS